ncbi:hypothetical protein [Dyadobacter luticola]|uniref:hypothetical protein n=1 Tax=Dyadobacter luticola TaxID=1979387 RepID=UPI001E34E1F0|nr:hypothetical protein [Dyadobacter luticola]
MFTSIRRLVTLVLFSHQLHLLEIEMVFLKTWKLALVIIMALLLHSCSLQLERTTTVYGTITDENGQPVDSIMVLVQGARFLKHEPLFTLYDTFHEAFSSGSERRGPASECAEFASWHLYVKSQPGKRHRAKPDFRETVI